MGHGTHDMWHMTRDMWHVTHGWGDHATKKSAPRSYGLWFRMSRRLGGKDD